MLARTAGSKGALHALVGLHNGVDVGIESLPGIGEQIQGIKVCEALQGSAGEGGILLVTGAVASVMRDVERLEALRSLGVDDGVELVGVHVVGGAVGILGNEPHGLFLCGKTEAQGQQKRKKE